MQEYDKDREESGEIIPDPLLAKGLNFFGKSLKDKNTKPTSTRNVTP